PGEAYRCGCLGRLTSPYRILDLVQALAAEDERRDVDRAATDGLAVVAVVPVGGDRIPDAVPDPGEEVVRVVHGVLEQVRHLADAGEAVQGGLAEVPHAGDGVPYLFARALEEAADLLYPVRHRE